MKQLFLYTVLPFYFSCNITIAQGVANRINKALELKDLYDEYMDYYDQIDDARLIAKSLEAGKKSDKKFGKWESIAFGLRKSINNMNDYKFVDPIEKDTIPLSAKDFFDCSKRENNLKILQDFQSNINVSIVKNTEILDEITKYEAAVDSASKIIFYLIDIQAKLSQLPVYKEIAKWDWLEFETGVRPEMDELLSVLRRKKREFTTKLDKSKGNKDNLSYNTESIMKSVCGFEGTYTGECNVFDEMTGNVKLIVTKDKGEYKATFYLKVDDEDKVFHFDDISLVMYDFPNKAELSMRSGYGGSGYRAGGYYYPKENKVQFMGDHLRGDGCNLKK